MDYVAWLFSYFYQFCETQFRAGGAHMAPVRCIFRPPQSTLVIDGRVKSCTSHRRSKLSSRYKNMLSVIEQSNSVGQSIRI